jgi:hypothetical protein
MHLMEVRQETELEGCLMSLPDTGGHPLIGAVCGAGVRLTLGSVMLP